MPVQVHHEELVQFLGREAGSRRFWKERDNEADRLLAFVHGSGGHGVKATDLTSHRESGDAKHLDGFRHREQSDRENSLLVNVWHVGRRG